MTKHKLFEDISIDPILLDSLDKQISTINAEINQAFQLRKKSDLSYMREISKKYNTLEVNNEIIPFKLVIGNEDGTLADYDLYTKEISYYWGNSLKRIDPSVIRHEAYHHLQLEKIIDELIKYSPNESREAIRKKVINKIINTRKKQEKIYDSVYGEGTTYDYLYFFTSKELVNYADKIALDLAKYMKHNKDYLYLYKLKNLLSDFEFNYNKLKLYNKDLSEISKFYRGVINQINIVCDKLFKEDPINKKKLFKKLLKQLYTYIVNQLQKYVEGQSFLNVMQEKLAVPTVDTHIAFSSADKVKDLLLRALSSDSHNEALYNKIVKSGFFKNDKLYIKLDRSSYKVPVILAKREPGGPRGRTGRFGKWLKEPAICLFLILNPKAKRVVYSYEYDNTLDHEVTHLLQNYSVAIKYLSNYNKKLDSSNIKNMLNQVILHGKGATVKNRQNAAEWVAYYQRPDEMGARAMVLYKELLKDSYLLNKVLDYLEYNKPDFHFIDKMLKKENLPGYKDFVAFSNKQMKDTGEPEFETAGWDLRQELLAYLYKIYLKDKSIRR